MATSQNAFIGRTSGSVGGVTFSKWKDKNVIKQKAVTVANPRTDMQVANRNRFTTLMAIGRQYIGVLRIGFLEYAGRMTWLNRFMQTNSFNGFIITDEVTKTQLIEYKFMTIAEGKILPTAHASTANGTTASIIWNPTPTGNQATSDLAIALLISDSDVTEVTQLSNINRSAGSLTVPLNATNGSTVYTYLFFLSASGKAVSNSMANTCEAEV